MQPGSLIADRYRIEDSIGSGGMGSVWRGFDNRLKRSVAVKILKSSFENDTAARARFEHEAQAVASLRHGGIAALHDYGETHDESGAMISYLVMELIQGRSLTARLLDGPMEPDEAMRMCSQVAEALQCAHEAGIIHRDVKPANIMIDERGRAVLVDFGIALSAGRTAITESGFLLGTLYYASPEQLEGHELTTATDIYSLGAVAYECLAGNPPFMGDTAGTILNGHLNQPPPQLPSTVPPAPIAAVFQALAKDPGRRWPTAEAFAEASSAAAANPHAPQADSPQYFSPAENPSPAMPVATGPHPFDAPTAPNREVRQKNRRRRTLIVVSAAAAIVVAAAALMLWPLLGIADGGSGEGGTFGAQDSLETSGGPLVGEGGGNATKASTSDESVTESAESADDAATSEDTGSDDGGGDEATDEEGSDEPGSVEGNPAEMPDALGEWYSDSKAGIEEAGWTNVTVVADSAEPDNGVSECGVYSQDPPGGTPWDYDQPVTLYYWEIDPGNC